jgi:hypothetical protein
MAIDAPKPQGEGLNPYQPPGPGPFFFEEFDGIDTSTSRYGLDEKKMAWCDGWFPMGPKLLNAMPGLGPPLWSAPHGGQVVFFNFANIGTNPIMVAMHADGGMWQVNTNTQFATRIMPDGTILNPTQTKVGISQWGSQYVIIVAQQTNGYWLWDGTALYGAGTLAPPVTITAGGSNYSNPTVTATGGSGTGAIFSATVSNGVITGIKIINPGSGYLATDTVSLSIADSSGSSATATVTLMPYGISGSQAEIYVQRVWVINGATLTWTAPGSFSNFATSAGGGNTTSADSFLRVQYTQIKQTNGFLYTIADSSINYISGVTTSGSPPTTTFTNQNADPEVGTPWPATVDVFGRNIIFANPFGVQISYGAAVSKISEPLDGVYQTVPNFGGFNPSAAKHILFGKKIWILLLPIIDPVTGLQANKLLIWNGKIWFSSVQDVPLLYIQHQEINSILTAYGTDGQKVYPLFTTPSTAFTKTVQSKFWAGPGGYQMTKVATRLWAIFQFVKIAPITVTISVDSETTKNPITYTSSINPIPVKNASGTIIPVKNASSVVIPTQSVSANVYVLPPTAVGQQGALLGLTISTNEPTLSLWSAALQPEIEVYRG